MSTVVDVCLKMDRLEKLSRGGGKLSLKYSWQRFSMSTNLTKSPNLSLGSEGCTLVCVSGDPFGGSKFPAGMRKVRLAPRFIRSIEND